MKEKRAWPNDYADVQLSMIRAYASDILDRLEDRQKVSDEEMECVTTLLRLFVRRPSTLH